MNNRHRQFFKNLIEAARTEEGRASIEKYVNSASEAPPDLSPYGQQIREVTDELEPMSLSDTISSEADPLDYGEIVPAARVLQHTNVLESINVDEEAMQFYVNYSALELWKSAFADETETVRTVQNEKANGNKFHDKVVDTFLSNYDGATGIEIPKNYSFPYPPIVNYAQCPVLIVK